MKLEIITTGDGSSSISLVGLNEQYHSTHGAIAESEHVFIKNGLMSPEVAALGDISILEVGLGTGLNAFLSFLRALEKPDCKINYHALEPFPLAREFYNSLNYPQQLSALNQEEIFLKIHEVGFEQEIFLRENFKFCKHLCKLENYSCSKDSFDLVFFDAFGPRTQPELWEPEMLGKIFDLLKAGGKMITYCAKGSVKRDLKSIGFEVVVLPGPPGKREMTCALKKNCN